MKMKIWLVALFVSFVPTVSYARLDAQTISEIRTVDACVYPSVSLNLYFTYVQYGIAIYLMQWQRYEESHICRRRATLEEYLAPYDLVCQKFTPVCAYVLLPTRNVDEYEYGIVIPGRW